MAIIERRHRLPRDCYKGKITAAFTLCLKENVKIFSNHEIVTKFVHIIRKDENLKTQIKYLLDNPVRKGLVAYWQDYPFKGSIGCELEDVVNGII